MYLSKMRLFGLFIVLALVPLVVQSAEAQTVAKLYSSSGKVEARERASVTWEEAKKDRPFDVGDGVRTLAHSRAGVKFLSGYLVRLSPQTTITFTEKDPGKKQEAKTSILGGIAHFFSRKPKKIPKVETPQVSASVRGTEFVVEVTSDRTMISVISGRVVASNSLGDVEATAGQQVVAISGQAPTRRIIVSPLESVQWALRYPAILEISDYPDCFGKSADWQALKEGRLSDANFQGTSWRDAFGRSLKAYLGGDSPEAIRLLEKGPEGPTAGYHLYRSGLFLAVGSVDKALLSLKKAEELGTADSGRVTAGILAQRGIIAITLNDLEEAEIYAAKALGADPKSTAALLAASYVAQSKNQLKVARAMLSKAHELSPANAFVSTRLAEIYLGFGDDKAAASLLEEVIASSNNDQYADTVLGFVRLMQSNAEAAQSLFDSVLANGGEMAEAYLGRALALIQQGRLEEGRIELEKAVHLNPAVALYRSYLGKAYYEEEKTELAREEYDRAIELDKNDPTPFLYRAFLNLSDHRPVAALRDLEQSSARNDNRAVFRSQLLLDSDSGIRSASLGKIYSRLGFIELARVQAMKALSSDYSNYSAHFLLADLYRDTHLNSRAQTTENLIGRLLVPATFNSNSVNIGGDASLNEYTSLFDRPQSRSNSSIRLDSQLEQIQGQIDHTYAERGFGINLGYAGGYRGGFRNNDYSREHQVFTQGQYELGTDDTIVWDTAYTVFDRGDLLVGQDPFAEDLDTATDFDGALMRLGYRHKIAPGTNILSSVVYNYGNFQTSDKGNFGRIDFVDVTEDGISISDEPFAFDGSVDQDLETDQHFLRGDLQLIWDTEFVSFVFGGSARMEDDDSSETATIGNPGSDEILGYLQGFPLSSSAKNEQNSQRVFLYSLIHPTKWLDLTLGLVYARTELSQNAFNTPFVDDQFDDDAVNPKVGLVIRPLPGLQLRAAYTETLDRTERGGLGPLEPTFVGGFNQVFDGIAGSEQKLYAVGADYHVLDDTFIGVNYQRREINRNVPVYVGGLNVENGSLATNEALQLLDVLGEADIDKFEVYLYQIIGERIATRFTYDFERFDETRPLPETQTSRFASRLQYFHPSGMFSFIEGTFRYQERAGNLDPKEINDFWILDAGAGYEFDNQHGAVSLRLLNLLDESFSYSSIGDESSLYPRFGAVVEAAYNF
jgi:tetratricopeptide (TPR) repeat protein